MMSDDPTFDAAVATVLEHEGGYVDDPHDPGGETKFGISKRSYPKLDIAHLTEAQAAALYRTDWWDRYGYGRLPASVGAKVFDLAVNMGPGTAHKMLQAACTDCGHPLVEDGKLGPATIAAAAACDAGELLDELRERAVRHYEMIAHLHPRLAKYLNGWCRRAES